MVIKSTKNIQNAQSLIFFFKNIPTNTHNHKAYVKKKEEIDRKTNSYLV